MSRIFARLAAIAAGVLTPALLAAGALASTCPPAPCAGHQAPRPVPAVRHHDPGPCRHHGDGQGDRDGHGSRPGQR